MKQLGLEALSGRASLVLEQFQKDGFGQFLEVFALGHDIEVDHCVIDAHPLQLDGLVHVRQVQQLYHVIDFDQADQVLLAQSLQPIKPVLVRGHQYIDRLVRILDFDQLVRIYELEQFFEGRQAYVLYADHGVLRLTHADTEHVLKEVATRGQDALVGLHFRVADDEGHVGEVFVLEHLQQVFWKLRLGHLDTYREHPDVVEAQFAVIAAEDVELTLHDVGCVPASGPRLKLARDYLLPVIVLNVKDVHVVHPVHAVVTTEIYDLGVNQASRRRHPSTWLITGHLRLYPSQSLRIQVENVVELAQLVGLTAQYINLFIEGDRRVLKATDRCNSLRDYGTAPFEIVEV